MGDSMAAAYSSPRPTPQFYVTQDQTFSTKKERKSGTPRDCPPLRPPTPVKSCPPVSRIFYWKNVNSKTAQVVSFRESDNHSLSPSYNENLSDSYFEQMFEGPTPIGSGSFGDVFKVRNRDDGKYYAVKKSKDRFKGQYDRKRKMEEVAKHETLPPHQNCVQFFNAWEERGHLYIQTELCKMSVSQYCEENHNITESVIWNYMVDLLMAVKHLHERNLVHMDIKPDNAFVSFDDVCKLGDFGLVIDMTKQKDVTDAMEGDPKYLAPELLEGTFGKAADVFSLGIFFLELACDLDLPRGGDAWHILRSGKLPESLMAGRSFDLKNVLSQMLDPDYKTRPTVDQCLAFPCIKSVSRTRLKRFMYRGALRRLRSNTPSPPTFTPSKAVTPKVAAPPTPSRSPLLAHNGSTSRQNGSNDSMSEDDCGRLVGSRGVNPDLNASDEFVLPRNPAPRRAFTTPAVRRRPASSLNNSSPIKRLLFASDLPRGVGSSPVSSRRGYPPFPDRAIPSTITSANDTGSPVLSPSTSSNALSGGNKSSSDNNDSGVTSMTSMSRPGTPPMSSVMGMDCDSARPSIEPKNLLGMFEAASDDEDM